MSKLYFAILCLNKKIRAAIHGWRCGFGINGTAVYCECTDLREALHLMDAGFKAIIVDFQNDGKYDTFWFKRTAALLKELTNYRRAIRGTVNGVDYNDYTAVCSIPGSVISPIDEMLLDNIIAPRGHIREAFAYENWPVEKRKEYISSSADNRENMVAAAYSKG